MADNPGQKKPHRRQGIFIVLEGADGSGKTTQFKLLHERLLQHGFAVEIFDFPRYDEPSSHFVRKYLVGEYGPADQISPYTASLFYALDRFEAKPLIKKALSEGKIVLSDRFVGSNMAHQGAKFQDSAEKRGFFLWEDGLEYELLGIPRPDLNVYLRVPAEVSYKLISGRDKRSYTNDTHDEHEKDINHLKAAVSTYDSLHRLFPKDFYMVECTKNGRLLPKEEINKKIWKSIEHLLPNVPKNPLPQVSLPAERKEIHPKATVKNGNGSDAENTDIQITVEGISQLAALYIDDFDGVKTEEKRLWATRKLEETYYTPDDLPQDVINDYQNTMKSLSDNYKLMQKELVAYFDKHKQAAGLGSVVKLLEPTIPLASLTSVKISSNKDSLRSLIEDLRTHSIPELRTIAVKLQSSARSLEPNFFKSEQEPTQGSDTPELVSDTIAKLVQAKLPNTLSSGGEELELLNAAPRNEFELIADGLYSKTSMTRGELLTEIETWTYEQKKDALFSVVDQADPVVMDQAKYHFNAIADRGTFSKLSESAFIEDLQLQPPTPRYGYDVPADIEKAQIDGLYLDNFDSSLALYSFIQAAGKEELAAYATLLGHKTRGQFYVSGRKLLDGNFRDSASLKELTNKIKERISEVHPLLSEKYLQVKEKSIRNKHSRSRQDRRRANKAK